MAVNPDAKNRLSVKWRTPRAGSCLTAAMLEELADLLDIQLPTAGSAAAPCISRDANNLAQLDPQNCVLVPGAKLYTEEQTWSASAATDVDFEGFAAQQIDPTACLFCCYLLLDSAEAGKDVQGDPSGSVNVRPNFEVVELSSSKITIAVKNATSDVTVKIQLLQLPIPPEQA